jgi:hypothetical protein
MPQACTDPFVDPPAMAVFLAQLRFLARPQLLTRIYASAASNAEPTPLTSRPEFFGWRIIPSPILVGRLYTMRGAIFKVAEASGPMPGWQLPFVAFGRLGNGSNFS